MCGRYTQATPLKALQERFGFKTAVMELKASYNIAPSQAAPVVVNLKERRLELFRWGLIPSWAKDPAIGYKMINARAETLLEKPSFKRPFEKSRCLVIADGFYEWAKAADAKTKTPMRIVLRTRDPFAIAGLWDVWKDPAGQEVRSFTIITTAANDSLKPIHDRMPVILGPQDEESWLDPESAPEGLTSLLRPYPDDGIDAYEVSTMVNAPKNDRPECIEEVARPLP